MIISIVVQYETRVSTILHYIYVIWFSNKLSPSCICICICEIQNFFFRNSNKECIPQAIYLHWIHYYTYTHYNVYFYLYLCRIHQHSLEQDVDHAGLTFQTAIFVLFAISLISEML